MAAFVIDASASAASFFRDEGTVATQALLPELQEKGACVPAIWPLECANLLRQGERRRRLSAADAAAAILLLRGLPVRVEATPAKLASGPVLDLARKHSLTAYDAAYLELALRLGLPLASKDAELVAAAVAEGVALLTL